MEVLPCIAVLLLLLSCSLELVRATAPAGTIERASKQQILASLPPGGQDSPPPVLFLTSPSGKYAAYFVRTHTVPGAGGLGADFCYVEVRMPTEGEAGSGTGGSVWESECRPVSTVNTCTLLFSWHGLEVFDGSEEVWHGETNTDGTNFLQTLELVDDGDMRVRDKDGELAWRASDEPRHGQRCGAPGSPGLDAALPPFAEPIGSAHHRSNLPFGQVHGAGNGHAAELPQAADLGDGVATGVGALGAGISGVDTGAGALGDGNGIAPTPGPLGDSYGIAPGARADPFGDVAGHGEAAAATAAGRGVAGTAGFGSQPLVNNSPYDSAAGKDGPGASLIGAAVLVCAMALGF